MKDSGGGANRSVQLTDLGLRIVIDQRPDSPEREAAIKQAALLPKIHAELWRKYGTTPPSDANLHHELVYERKFNENAVQDFIKEYKDTIRFAKLTDSDTISGGTEDREQQEEDEAMSAVQPVQPSAKQSPPPPGGPPRPERTAVGNEIPVTADCIMGVNAMGRVTQGGIDKLIAYLQLIKGSFPQNGGV
jgi:hypothetical protein